MRRRWPRRRKETYEQLRVRMIVETSVFLTQALRRPELAVRIPTIPADRDRFPPAFTVAFWDPILFD